MNIPPEDGKWIAELPQRIKSFLQSMRSDHGYFRYSLTGDLYGPDTHWGLSNTVFAVRTMAILGDLDSIDESERASLRNRILSFRRADGFICDPVVQRASGLMSKLSALRQLNFRNFFNQQVRIAETRQAVVALRLLGDESTRLPDCFAQTPDGIDRYLSGLNWSQPWGAGSHFSHLVRYLIDLPDHAPLVEHAVEWVMRLQQDDGCWYRGRPPSVQQRINGAMKVLMGLESTPVRELTRAKDLMDSALEAANADHACDQLDVVYVVWWVHRQLPEYRAADVEAFALQRIGGFRQHFHEKHGGFSFHIEASNERYFGARITRGLNEPDVHGTVLFVWGLSLLSELLGVDFDLHIMPV